LAAFKRENVGMMPGEGGDYYTRLQQEVQRLEGIEEEIRLTRQRRDELRRQLDGEEPLAAGAGESSTVIDAEITQYEEQLATLRLRFTDSHPDVIQVLSVLDGLRAQREQLLASPTGSSVSMPNMSSLDMNPVYQQMKMNFNQSEIDLRELESQRNSQARRVNQLRQRVDTIPEVEAELKRLVRNNEVTRSQYDQLLRRLEQAKLSGAAEESKEDVKFRIIDPPSVSAEPVGPNRPLLTTGALLLALAGAVAVSFLFNLMRPVFFSTAQLERNFPYPVLGAVTMAPGTMRGVGLVSATMLSVAFGALLAVYVVLFLFSASIAGIVDAAGGVIGL
jgi:polysaccharide chain length determinant protein (PEP-CTERM system associated)